MDPENNRSFWTITLHVTLHTSSQRVAPYRVYSLHLTSKCAFIVKLITKFQCRVSACIIVHGSNSVVRSQQPSNVKTARRVWLFEQCRLFFHPNYTASLCQERLIMLIYYVKNTNT
jgi:hypothetical protein